MTDWQKSTGKTDAWDYKTQKEFVGIYRGFRENIGPNGSMMYEFTTDKGPMGIWGTALIDRHMMGIKIGEQVKMVYLGKETNPKTGRSYHSFDIFHREIDVTVPPEVATQKDPDGSEDVDPDGISF